VSPLFESGDDLVDHRLETTEQEECEFSAS
jgi:hypothetical protein